jgi:hypothetical protein
MIMNGKSSRLGPAYLPLGLVVTGCTGGAFALGLGGRRLVEGLSKDAIFAYAVATGIALVLAILWQWRLYFVRRSRSVSRIQREYSLHRWLGILPIALLAVHMGKPQASLMSLMSYGLLVSSMSGLFNHEILRQRHPHIRKAWLILHVGSAGFILPLILLHVWAALAFKAF